MVDDIQDASLFGSNNWLLVAHGLQYNHPQPLEVAATVSDGRLDKGVALLVKFRQLLVGNIVQQPHPVTQTQFIN